MSDEAKAFIALGENYASHDTVKHSSREYVRDAVFPRPSHNCRRLSSYQPAACRPVFPRDRLPLVTAHCYAPGSAEKPKRQGTHENAVVAGAAGAAIAASLSRRYRPPNAQKSGRWDHRHISSRCLWLIKAMYRRARLARSRFGAVKRSQEVQRYAEGTYQAHWRQSIPRRSSPSFLR